MKPEWESIHIEENKRFRLWDKESWQEVKLEDGERGLIIGWYKDNGVLKHKLIYNLDREMVGIMYNDSNYNEEVYG